MKQFDLETYNRLFAEGKTPKIVTRGGRDVRILCTDRKGVRPIIALHDSNECVELGLHYPNGHHCVNGISANDLFFADTEPTYRPYRDADECFKDVVKHGGWVRQKSNGVYFHLIAVDDNEVNYTEHVSESFMKLLERNVWADDGQPCGVKEE